MINEPQITIGGVPLTYGQSMTVRVALSHFGIDLEESPLGENENAKAITKGYLDNLTEINRLIHESVKSQEVKG